MQVQLYVLNFLHINLKFTLETETALTFHFLNVNIKYDNNRFSTQTYFKPTNTALRRWVKYFIKIFKIKLQILDEKSI